MADKTRLLGSSVTNSITLAREALGPPGVRALIHVVPEFAGRRTPSDEEILSDSSERKFVVCGSLSKAPEFMEGIRADFSERDGSSYLVIPSAASQLAIDVPQGRFHARKNEAGELSYIEYECSANHWGAARFKFIDAVYPALDHWSYKYGVPIYVKVIRAYDTKNHTTHIEFTGPYRNGILEDAHNMLFVEMRPIYSMYREAKNSESDFYKFLCYFKIMEGLLGKMRAKLIKRAKSRDRGLIFGEDLVPDDEHIPQEFRSYVGKSIKAFFDKALTGKFRHAVAHFITTDDRVLHVSAPADLHSYATVSYVCDLCVRTLVTNHERLLAQLA
jgi:hypothetical protein